MTAPSPRRRFQFRLRTLFVGLTIVAIQCAVCLPALKEWRAQEVERKRRESVPVFSFSFAAFR
jgi:hypothetical protein